MGPQGIGLEITELRLGLPGSGSGSGGGGGGEGGGEKKVDGCGEKKVDGCGGDVVVGWPPVCMYRRNSMSDGVIRKMYVKVSMDGAPILRKVDLSSCKGYLELGMALEMLFGCSGIGEAMKEESESSEYVAIYEDKDGDWMLVGDVPWLMFTETCKRLRIKRRSYMNGSGLHGIPK